MRLAGLERVRNGCDVRLAGLSADACSCRPATGGALGAVTLQLLHPLRQVVLSEPLNRPRACNFAWTLGGYGGFSTGDDYGDYATVADLYDATVTYSPPASTISCDNIGAWRTNAAESNLKVASGGNRDGDPPFVEWRFSPRAPSAWELSQMGVEMVYTSKQLTHPPEIRAGGNAACELRDNLDRDLPLGCSLRELPSAWLGTCPLRVGGQLTCYYLPSPSDDARFHGCNSPNAEPSTDTTLSTATAARVGTGPPNPYCMTIFPPSWRVKDWYVATWLAAFGGFDPNGLLIAGVILCGVFGLAGLGLLYCSRS